MALRTAFCQLTAGGRSLSQGLKKEKLRTTLTYVKEGNRERWKVRSEKDELAVQMACT